MRIAQASTEHVLELHIRIFFRQAVTTSRHSCEVSSTFALSTLVTFFLRFGPVQTHACNALNFFHAIAHGVETREVALAFKAARLAEVKSAEQFADQQNVGSSPILPDAAASNPQSTHSISPDADCKSA